MAYKTFVAGEILTAADVNSNLMNQAIAVFADSGARGSAIASPVEGQFTFRTDEDLLEFWDGSEWQVAGAGLLRSADVTATTGSPDTGTFTDGGVDYAYYVFKGSGSITFGRAGAVDVCAVAGGGGGGGRGSRGGGGGGAGDGVFDSVFVSAETKTVTIGGGGSKETQGSPTRFGAGKEFYAAAGGAGLSDEGSVGASGGGGSGDGEAGGPALGLGNAGGQGQGGGSFRGGGGGGLGAVGATGTASGNGGAGSALNIITTAVATTLSVGEVSGSDVFFGGGGGGGIVASSGAGVGGVGGGGNGATNNSASVASLSGDANTGGGGGGSRADGTAGNGGSGVVIVRVRA